MANFQGVPDTLYIPLAARIYASKRFPEYFFDAKALSLEGEIPSDSIQKAAGEYFNLASVARYHNLDSITRDFDWGDTENNRLLFEMAAKYGTPYFSNYINSDMEPSDVRSMCCRLRLDLRELRKQNGGNFGAGENTGSIGVVTINMPRIAYLASDEEDFFRRLDRLCAIADTAIGYFLSTEFTYRHFILRYRSPMISFRSPDQIIYQSQRRK